MTLTSAMLSLLWREVALHEEFAENAVQALHKVEAALAKCGKDAEIARRAEITRVLAEIQELKKRIVEPDTTLRNYVQS